MLKILYDVVLHLWLIGSGWLFNLLDWLLFLWEARFSGIIP